MNTSGYWLLTAHNFTGFVDGRCPRWAKDKYQHYSVEMIQKYYSGNVSRQTFDVRSNLEDAKIRAASLIPFCQMVSLEWVGHNSKLLGTLSKSGEWRLKPE